MKRNREECKELARLAENVVFMVANVTRDVPSDGLDEKMKEHVTELERCDLLVASSAPR